MIPARLSLVTIGARDVRALRAFYERLGWVSNSPPGDDFAAFPLGGAILGLYAIGSLAEETGLEPGPQGPLAGFNCAINVERAEQVDESLAAAVDAGGSVIAAATTREWGGRSGYFADPEGNVWEVAHLPGSQFDERGALIWPY
jgi:predicted enzyme related to lactoylglutathione lyase